MIQLSLNIFFCLLTTISIGQSNSNPELNYKPINLDEAVLQLEKIHHDSTKQKIVFFNENNVKYFPHGPPQQHQIVFHFKKKKKKTKKKKKKKKKKQ